MTESGVIQEFLISLGFKTDEAGQRRYQDSIPGITKGAAVLVTSLTGAAIAASAAIDKISTDLASLFYSSQSLHATAEGMTALSRALQDVTGSSEEGVASFAAFANKVRDNTLFKDVFKGLTEGLTFEEGHAEQSFVDAVDFFQKRVAAAKAIGDEHEVSLRNKQAAALGINSRLIDPVFAKLKEAFEKHAKELDPGYAKATEDAKNLRVAINGLGNAFKGLAIAVAAPLFAGVTPRGPISTVVSLNCATSSVGKALLCDNESGINCA